MGADNEANCLLGNYSYIWQNILAQKRAYSNLETS